MGLSKPRETPRTFAAARRDGNSAGRTLVFFFFCILYIILTDCKMFRNFNMILQTVWLPLGDLLLTSSALEFEASVDACTLTTLSRELYSLT